MKQKIKELLENSNFRNNQNYIFGDNAKSKILSLYFIYKKETQYYFISTFISIFICVFFINILKVDESLIVPIFMFLLINCIFIFMIFMPKIFQSYIYYFFSNKYLFLNIYNKSLKNIYSLNQKGNFKKTIENNFIIIKK